ncbi:hydrogen peroxide-dependent heme synthase [Nesterenkonia flava]|uniref:Coproheme decarboxylase n=1 Tax=Nesterenkonia flava TaxID=469799 RepID=A0ABU1FQD7_9MICC|nr:hydrogen peroxide-dependent heme synthase [Nesterenkonia flava]MDR5710862.1 chlorite dismutase family protein [Nesterenkonia flava]
MSEGYGRNPQRTAEDVNSSGKDWFTLFTVFKRSPAQSYWDRIVRSEPQEGRSAKKLTKEFDDAVAALAEQEIILRGVYDVSGMRADADVMLWLTGHAAEELQAALRLLHRTGVLNQTEIAFSAMGVHRTAEFARSHVPAFARGVEAEDWLVVYPFNRSYDWYLMEPAKRGKMLREHGMLGQEFPSVLANTTSAFALNDWEWLLALESPKLTDLVDMMRKLRESETRYHVRDETPFYTGRRLAQTDDILEVLA